LSKRSLAIVVTWLNQCVYYSEQLANAIYNEYDTTILTASPNRDEYDLVMYYFGNERHPDCLKGKIIQRWASFNALKRCAAGDINIAGSTLLRDVLLARDENTVLLPFGVNPRHFRQQPFPIGTLKVGFAGPDSQPKRLDKLRDVVDSIPGVELITAIYTADRGKYFGPYITQDMAQFYRQVHVYACSSSSEGFGCPLLEAAACGRPIVSFDVGIARDLRNTGAGIFIIDDKNDWDSFRDALIHIRDNQELIRELGNASAKAVRSHWTWDVLKPRWLEMLDDAYEYSHR
jgi:glycosyltransferase involved in cell wall biosynthesis